MLNETMTRIILRVMVIKVGSSSAGKFSRATQLDLVHPEIHATMLRDTVRTMSYAKFILSNPQMFRDKLVMDVGCGTPLVVVFVEPRV